MADQFNPIQSVQPCYENGTTYGTAVTDLPCPSSYTWDLEDISESDAGRTQDGSMHKKLLGQAVSINLAWRNISSASVSKILKAFNTEYVKVNYWDAMKGAQNTLVFYVGNRTAPMYSRRLNLWQNLSFKLVTQDGTPSLT